MTGFGPDDPQVREEWRRARRRVARVHHPDVGGDLETYLQELAHVDARFAVLGRARCSSHTGGVPPLEVRRTPWTLVWRSLRRRARAARGHVRIIRARLPRRMPGARRYIDL